MHNHMYDGQRSTGHLWTYLHVNVWDSSACRGKLHLVASVSWAFWRNPVRGEATQIPGFLVILARYVVLPQEQGEGREGDARSSASGSNPRESRQKWADSCSTL